MIDPVVQAIDVEAVERLDGTSIAIDFEPLTQLSVIRPADLFNGMFRFRNFHRNTLTGHAQRKEADRPAILSLDLPGQHFGERALAVNAQMELPLKARLAGRSRIAVKMPQGVASLPLTTEHLLDALRSWPLSLDPLALYTDHTVHREMIGSVKDTFFGLAIQLWAELLRLGLNGVVSSATPRINGLVDLAQTTLGDVSPNASGFVGVVGVFLRGEVEKNAEALAGEAAADYGALSASVRDGLGLGQDGPRIVREIAEAYLEVQFAHRLAKHLLDQPGEISSGVLAAMSGTSGLFDLMMHPHPPPSTVTALELPYRLITSPGAGTSFHHNLAAETRAYDRGERTELWTSTLRQAGTGWLAPEALPADGVDFFAMWSPDYLPEPSPAAPDFQMSLTGRIDAVSSSGRRGTTRMPAARATHPFRQRSAPCG